MDFVKSGAMALSWAFNIGRFLVTVAGLYLIGYGAFKIHQGLGIVFLGTLLVGTGGYRGYEN